MLEKIRTQIKELLKQVKTLETQEIYNIDNILKENKYIKSITQKYFEEEPIEQNIKQHKKLIEALKKHHIKLTDKQKETETKHTEYIKEVTKSLESLLTLINKISKKETYIDIETIELLKIDSEQELKEIIEYNKNINLKKQKPIVEQKQIKEIKKKVEEKQPEINVEKAKPKEEKPTEKIRQKTENSIEEILLYDTLEELNEHLKKRYKIEIQTDKDIKDLNQLINIIEEKPFLELNEKPSLIKKILEESHTEYIKLIGESLNEVKKNVEIIIDDEEVFTNSELAGATSLILMTKEASQEEKEELLKLSKEKKQNILYNSMIIACYKLRKIKLQDLLKQLDIEKIDQLIESGYATHLRMLGELYKQKRAKLEKNYSFESFLRDSIYPSIYNCYFGRFVQGKSMSNLEDTAQEQIKKETETITKKIIESKRFNISPLCTKLDLKTLTSKNEILYRQKEINEASKKHMSESLAAVWKIEITENEEKVKLYLNILEKYRSKNDLEYVIPISKSLCPTETVIISKNKVKRLLGEHVIRNNEITKEIVKECMLYNMIITDDILEELEKIIDDILEKKHQKIKKYK